MSSKFPSFFNFIEERPARLFLLSLIYYVVVFRCLVPPINAIVYDSGAEFIIGRSISNGLYQLVLFSPILFFRRVGFFHPLAFPALFAAAFDIVFQPLHLFFPVITTFKQFLPFTTSYSLFMTGVDGYEYSALQIKFDFIRVIFLLSMYSGFYIVHASSKLSSVYTGVGSAAIRNTSAFYVGIAAVGATVFIVSRGGIEQQILSFYQGRYETLEGLGVFTGPVKASLVALMLWLVCTKADKPSFWYFAFAACILPLYWLVDGSRSSVLLLLLSLLIVYMMKSRRVPVSSGVVLAAIAFMLFGILGMLRQDYAASNVDFSVLSPGRVVEAIEASQKETNKRTAEEGDIAVLKAMQQVGLIWGRSYLAIVAFPIPRALWSEKPKNVFVYVNWVAFQGNPLADSAPDTWGIPIEPATEAFWNFGVLGLVLVGAMVGLLKRLLMNVFRRNPSSPWVCVLYVVSLFYLTGGSRYAFYFIQNASTLLFIYAGSSLLQKISAR